MKKIFPVLSLFLTSFLLTSKIFAQGCETILMNGVFNTFNYTSGNYSSAEWHNYWCNGTVEKITSSSSGGAALNIGIAKISLGMSFDDAKEFQRVYQSIYCGSDKGKTVNISTNSVIQKVASPDILNAYVKCKEIENGGLKINLNLRPQDNQVFVLDVTFTKAWGNDSGPRVRKVSFVPNVITTREGSLQDGINLKTGITYSLIAQRSTDVPITVYLETEVGTYSASLPAFIPPPTDQERIMSAMPKGTIMGWYDATKIPKGWAICDGTAGTPNLVDKFPLGTNNISELGTTPPNSTATHKHIFSATTDDFGSWIRNEGGNIDTKGLIEHKTSSNEFGLHRHTITKASTDEANWIPPAVKIIFIMKL